MKKDIEDALANPDFKGYMKEIYQTFYLMGRIDGTLGNDSLNDVNQMFKRIEKLKANIKYGKVERV